MDYVFIVAVFDHDALASRFLDVVEDADAARMLYRAYLDRFVGESRVEVVLLRTGDVEAAKVSHDRYFRRVAA